MQRIIFTEELRVSHPLITLLYRFIMPTHLLLTFIKNIEDCCSRLFLTYWQKRVVNLKAENLMMNLMLISCHMIELVLFFFFFLALHISLYSDTEIMHKMKYEHSKWGKNRIQIARIILINFLWVYRYMFLSRTLKTASLSSTICLFSIRCFFYHFCFLCHSSLTPYCLPTHFSLFFHLGMTSLIEWIRISL